MREALHGLTLRGKAFLGAGVAAVVAGMLLDQHTLIRAGVLAFVLPFVTAYVVGRGRYRLALVRTVTPGVVTAGQTARVELALTNDGWITTGALLLEEALPYPLGSRPRFTIGQMRHAWVRKIDYPVRSDVRGRFEIGPMSVRVADAFGLVELDRTFSSTGRLVVTPRTVELTPIPLAGGQTSAGDARPRAFASGSAEDVTVREYRRGDELRRVHWRATAKMGELMVRREEQPWQARATVLLDDRAGAHRGTGPASTFEAAVSAAASVLLHLEQRGYTVRVATASGTVHADGLDRRTTPAATMEALAAMTLSPATTLDASWLDDFGGGTLLVAVLGALGPADPALLGRLRHASGAGLALVSSADDARLLTGQGWKASLLTPGEQLDEAWQRLRATAAPTGHTGTVGGAGGAGGGAR